MASPLRNPWAVAGLAALAVAFLAWRLAPLLGLGGSPAPEAVVASDDLQPPAPSSPEASANLPDTASLPAREAPSDDSLGGWDVPAERDPFLRIADRPKTATRSARRAPASLGGGPIASAGREIALRGLATGSANLVLAQGRVVAEGDTLAGGFLRAIRLDRIVVRRPAGDTVFFFPRGTLP